MMFETTPGRGVGPRKVLRHRGKRHEHLVVVGPAVVAVLILVADLADDRVAEAVDRDLLAERLRFANSCSDMSAPMSATRRTCRSSSQFNWRPYSRSRVRMSW